MDLSVTKTTIVTSWFALLSVTKNISLSLRQKNNKNKLCFPDLRTILHQRQNLTRSTGTVHTSAKARLTRIRTRIRIRICDPDTDRHQNLNISSLVHCRPSLKTSCKSVRKFLRKVGNRQTNKQTNNDENITSLAKVIIHNKDT